MSATSSWPVPWKTAAAMIRIAPLMKSANISATVESIDAKRIASRLLVVRVAGTSASARSTSAGRGCAASPSRRGCRSRCRACPGSCRISVARDEAGRDAQPDPAAPARARRRTTRRSARSARRRAPRRSGSRCCCRNRTISTSSAVRQTPQISGRPNSRFSAIAAPITSARSQAAIAISHSTHRTIVDRPRVAVAAGLREIAAAGDAEPRGQRLQQDRHQVRHHDDAEQRVAVARAAGEVGRPVAGIHVADGDEVARTGEGEELAPEAGGRAARQSTRALRAGSCCRLAAASREGSVGISDLH